MKTATSCKSRRPSPCYLLENTPIEVRRLIYVEIIKSWGLGSTIHIFVDGIAQLERMFGHAPRPNHRHDSLAYIHCENMKHLNDQEHFDQISSWLCLKPMPAPENMFQVAVGNIWALLLTCKQIHSEASGLLYSSFTFDLRDLTVAHQFLHQIPQLQLNHISSLCISYAKIPNCYTRSTVSPSPPVEEHNPEWVGICAKLGSMTGLRKLRINFYNKTQNEVREVNLLSAVSCQTRVRDQFVVQLPRCDTKTAVVQNSDMPFQIERRETGKFPLGRLPVTPLPVPFITPLAVPETLLATSTRVAWAILGFPITAFGWIVDGLRPPPDPWAEDAME